MTSKSEDFSALSVDEQIEDDFFALFIDPRDETKEKTQDMLSLLRVPNEKNENLNQGDLTREKFPNLIEKWLDAKRFDVFHLMMARVVALYILSLPVGGQVKMKLPEEVSKLNFTPFDLIPLSNRKSVILSALNFACAENELELLGRAGLDSVMAKIDAMCIYDAPQTENAPEQKNEIVADSTAKFVVDKWVQRAIISKIKVLPKNFLEEEFFDICPITELGSNLELIAEEACLSKINFRKTAHYILLNSMHCMNVDDIDLDVVDGLPNAMLAAIGLNEANCDLLLGEGSWAEINNHYYQWTRPAEVKSESISESSVDSIDSLLEKGSQEDFEKKLKKSWWRRIGGK